MCFIAGVLVLGVVWLGPLPELARGAFWAHMTMHMTVVAIAAPLLAFGLAGSRYDPVARWPGAFNPIAASVVELMIVWAWHAPGLHHFARDSAAGLAIEQATFLGAGVFLWVSAVGGAVRPFDRLTVGPFGAAHSEKRGRAAGGVVGLLLTAMHMTLLGALLALATRPLFHAGSVSGMTALEDQHLGGAIMILVGGAAYLAGGLYLTLGLVRRSFSGGEEKAVRRYKAGRSGSEVRLTRRSAEGSS